jgi:hypothetical protein
MAGTYSLSALQPGRVFDCFIDGLHVRNCVGRVLVRCLVEKDAVHCQTIVFCGPACVRCYLGGNQRNVLGGIAGPHVSDGFYVGVVVELGDLSRVVIVWICVVARTAAGIYHYQELEFWVSFQPDLISMFIESVVPALTTQKVELTPHTMDPKL